MQQSLCDVTDKAIMNITGT